MKQRLILWLALAGMVLTLHLWIQKSRGFDQGCLGLATHAEVVIEKGCREVSELPESHLFGVSNAAWGYAFYFVVALLAFGKIVSPVGWARRMHAASEALTALAFLYSLWLVYQMSAAGVWCVLCLTSGGLVTLLLALHIAVRRGGGFRPVEETARGLELGLAVGGLFAMSGVLVGVLLFVNRLGTRPLEQGRTGLELRQAVGRALPFYIDGDKLREMRACRFERSQPVLDLTKFVEPDTPFVGDAAAIRVVLFVDPNCGHCAEYFPEFMQVAEALKGRAGFTVLPVMLWETSRRQVAALKIAQGSGKYFELWRLMFARQTGPRRGMTVEQIAGLFREVGLDATNLEARLTAAAPAADQVRAAARAGGIEFVPAVYMNGLQVWAGNQSPECLATLVERLSAESAK